MLTGERHLIPLKVSEQKRSRNDSDRYVTITFFDVESGREVKTHVVSCYGNFTRWRKVINLPLPDSTAILKGNFRFKDIDIIDADSSFEFHPGVTMSDVEDIVLANT